MKKPYDFGVIKLHKVTKLYSSLGLLNSPNGIPVSVTKFEHESFNIVSINPDKNTVNTIRCILTFYYNNFIQHF